jgi:adenylate cyclase
MSQKPEDYSLAGEKRNLTVLFSDVRGFTTISEGMDPRQLSDLMNAFLTPMTEIIHRNRGTIDKYMGDAIMAFWGAPVEDQSHAEHALTTAMEMIAELTSLRPEYIANGWPEIKIGVGLNTGEMNVGNMGSEFRMAYTVLGDVVNLGSRLEGLTKEYGVDVIISESTLAECSGWVARELDIVRVKGKKKPVRIYEPICREQQLEPSLKQELVLYNEALKRFRRQDWDGAEMQFISLSNEHPASKIYRLYIKRITSYRKQPPAADWDGVFTHLTK